VAQTREDAIRQAIKLMTKAERTDVTAEAEALTAKAVEMIDRWSVTQAMIDAFRPPSERTRPTRKFICYSPNKMYLKQRGHLLSAVAQGTRCRVVLSNEERHAELFGFADDVEFAELLYTSLLTQMAHEADRALMQHEGRYGREDNRYAWKRNFKIGFIQGAHARMQEQLRRVVAEADVEHRGRAALVLVGRENEVNDMVAEVYPRLLRGRKDNVSNYDAASRGRAAGLNAKVNAGRAPNGAHSYVDGQRPSIGGGRGR
jgi:hypothetical protein